MLRTLVDTGPLVALMDKSDTSHDICRDTLRNIRGELHTVWPVITEAMYLLSFSWQAQEAIWEMIESSAVSLLPLDLQDASRMRALMQKYRDLPMDFADAALVCVAEREHISNVFTLDRKDFRLYRTNKQKRFRILPGYR